jgi:uncharacterized membrane protein YfcA
LVTAAEQLAVLAAATGAGMINAVAGSGTLLTFPVLLAVGFPARVANVSNTIGLVAGGFSGVFGYRRELKGQRPYLLHLGVASLLGGLTGGLLLLVLPAAVFRAVVPALIALACVLVIAQPRLNRRLTRRPVDAGTARHPVLLAGVYGVGIYGGYFGAAQGVLLLSVLGLGLRQDIQRINGTKNVLAVVVNTVAALLFVVVADVAWHAVALIAAGSVVGGLLGARFGRLLQSGALRALNVTIGVIAVAKLLVS